MDSRWDRYDIIILISNSVWFREFRYNGLLKGADGDYRPDVISMNMKENYNYLATWRDLWRDVISMNMKENYNFKGADGDYRPHFFLRLTIIIH